MLSFRINLCLPVDCLPQEEGGRCLVLKVIEWPIYILLIDFEAFLMSFNSVCVGVCVCVRGWMSKPTN